MFDIGFWELLFVALIGLLVLGPQRLPEVARQCGRWYMKLQRMVQRFRSDLESQIDHSEMQDLVRNQASELEQLRSLVGGVRQDLERSLQGPETAPLETASSSPTKKATDDGDSKPG